MNFYSHGKTAGEPGKTIVTKCENIVLIVPNFVLFPQKYKLSHILMHKFENNDGSEVIKTENSYFRGRNNRQISASVLQHYL